MSSGQSRRTAPAFLETVPGVELRQEARENGHLFVAVLEHGRTHRVGDKPAPRFRIGRNVRRVEVPDPEAAPHLAAVRRVAAEMDEMSHPNWGFDESGARACHRGDLRSLESLHVEVLTRLSRADLELLKLAANVLVGQVSAADVVPCPLFYRPVGPDVVGRVPPLVILCGLGVG